ncbi:MAG: cytochrome P450 [Phototrophicaceae bacterium]
MATVDIPGMRNLLGLKNVKQIQSEGILSFLMNGWQEYGDFFFVELGTSGLHVVVDPDDVRKVLVSNKDNYVKGSVYDSTRNYLLGNGIVTSTGEDWLWQRRLLAPFFTPRGIEQYLQTFIDEGTKVIDKWAQQHNSETVLDMNEEMAYIALAIILKVIFSVESEDDLNQVKDDVEIMFDFVGARQRNIVKAPLWMPTEHNQRYKNARNRLHRFIEDLIEQRKSTPKDQWGNDLLSKMLLANETETERQFSAQDIIDQCITFFVAGHETTARSLTFALYAISTNPDVEASFINEIDREMSSTTPKIEELKQMPYLLRTIKETLRLYPSAAFYPRNVVGTDTLSGYTVTEGMQVFLFPYATHRHPDYWENPDQFEPNRFAPEKEAERHPYAYAPFSGGQRICIGNNFSLLESQVMLSLIYKRFKPQLVAGHDPQIKATATLVPTNGMLMTLQTR